MEYNEIVEKINQYISDIIGEDSFENDTAIFEEGLVSSLFAIELMTFLEQNFEIKITTNDLDMANYESVNCIADFVCKKKAGGMNND